MIPNYEFCNLILNILSKSYPGTMSKLQWQLITQGVTDMQYVIGHFKYLEEKGLIDTEVFVDDEDENDISYQINMAKTKINSNGIDIAASGGLK
ncbi:hypothetical protein AB4K08_01010 [Serratia fonticola]|uniref:hypothetical protein n=1 Tax=Serratia fonticola TaxID=47917 RepID=UPI0034C6C8CE